MSTHMMKALLVGLFFGLSCVTIGCASEAPSTGDPTMTEAELVKKTPLDRVTPAEVAATYAADLAPDIARCIAGNRNIVNVDRSNLDAFYRPGVQWYWGVREAVDGMLSEPGVTSIPVATLADAVGPWAMSKMSAHVDADGFYTRPSDAALTFYSAEMKTREEKALALAKAPGGRSLKEIRELWSEVEAVQGSLDSAWLNPVKVSGDPSLGDVRKAMKLRYAARYAAWGMDAIDEFHAASEGPDEAPEFEPIKEFLKSSAIRKRWLFQGGGDEWSTNVLVVLDEHNQLWGMEMGYSE